MIRKRTVLVAATTAMALSLCLFGCGSAQNAAEDTSATIEESQATDGSIENEDELKKQEFEDVKLIDNEYVEIDLVSLYQKETNWSRSNGTAEVMIDNNASIKIKNKTDGDLYVYVDGYLDDEKLMVISNSFTVAADKTSNESFGVFKDTQPDFTELDSFEDLTKVDLSFKITGNDSDGNYQEYGTVETKIGDAIAGKTASETSGEKQGEADQAAQAEEKAPTINPLNIGDTISNDNWDINLVRVDLTNEVSPSDTSGMYSVYEANSGTVIMDFVFDITCRASSAKTLDDVFGGARATYANKYEYETLSGTTTLKMVTCLMPRECHSIPFRLGSSTT